MHRRRAAALLLAASLVSAPVLVGCGGDDPGDDPSAGSSTEASPSDDSPSDGSTDEATEDAADGPELATDHVTLRLPEGWRVDEGGESGGPTDQADLSSIVVTDTEVPGSGYSLSRLARESINVLGPEIALTEQPTVEIGGVETYHLTGTFGKALDVEAYGPSVDGAVVAIRFELYTLNSEKQNQAIVDSVLASVEWNI